MTLLPVVARELSVAARSRWTHWLRFSGALVAVGITFALMGATTGRGMPAAELPGMIFGLVSSLLFGWCCLAGVFLTADCLSSEKRQGTLGLLFLTDLRGFDVVLGKAAVASAQSLCVVVAVLPVLAVPLMMGSVTWGQFVRMSVALVLTMLWSLALGTLVSSQHHDGRRAVLTTLGVVLVGLLGPVLLSWVARGLVGRRLMELFQVFSPVALVTNAYETAWVMPFHRFAFTTGLWITGGTVLLSLCGASRFLRRSWQSGASEEKTPAVPVGQPMPIRRRRQGWGWDSSPYEVIAGRDLQVPRLVRLIVGVAALVWLICLVYGASQPRGRSDEVGITMMLICVGLHLIVKLAVAVCATQRASEDAASGALELLLTTPLQPAQIRRGHLRVLSRFLFKTKVILSLMNLVTLPAMVHAVGFSDRDAVTFGIGFVSGSVLLWLDTRLLAELGLICGVRRKRHAWAAAEALGRTLLPGWAAFFATFLLLVGGAGSAEVGAIIFTLCALVCAAATLMQILACRHLGAAVFMQLTGGGWHFGRRGPPGGFRPPLPAPMLQS